MRPQKNSQISQSVECGPRVAPRGAVVAITGVPVPTAAAHTAFDPLA